MSMRLRFFKLPKHSVYSYKPRYWDPQKEELEERLKNIEDLQSGSVDAAKSRIAGGFKRGFSKGNHNWSTQYRRKQIARSNYILLITIAVLVVLTAYFLLRYMPSLSNLFN